MLLFSLVVLILVGPFIVLYAQPYHFNLRWWWCTLRILYHRTMIVWCTIRIWFWGQVIRCMGGTHGDIG